MDDDQLDLFVEFRRTGRRRLRNRIVEMFETELDRPTDVGQTSERKDRGH